MKLKVFLNVLIEIDKWILVHFVFIGGIDFHYSIE